jgi:hypothetical protein
MAPFIVLLLLPLHQPHYTLKVLANVNTRYFRCTKGETLYTLCRLELLPNLTRLD